MSPAIPRLVRAGGLGRAALRQALRAEGVRLNRAAEALFEHPRFEPSAEEQEFETRAFAVHELGLARGGTYRDVTERARALGFVEGPLELGPSLRLQYRDQEEVPASAPAGYGAPWGAITVASAPLDDDETTPRGFYLLRRDGIAWLRGYWASTEHVWQPADVLVFVQPMSRSAPWRS